MKVIYGLKNLTVENYSQPHTNANIHFTLAFDGDAIKLKEVVMTDVTEYA